MVAFREVAWVNCYWHHDGAGERFQQTTLEGERRPTESKDAQSLIDEQNHRRQAKRGRLHNSSDQPHRWAPKARKRKSTRKNSKMTLCLHLEATRKKLAVSLIEPGHSKIECPQKSISRASDLKAVLVLLRESFSSGKHIAKSHVLFNLKNFDFLRSKVHRPRENQIVIPDIRVKVRVLTVTKTSVVIHTPVAIVCHYNVPEVWTISGIAMYCRVLLCIFQRKSLGWNSGRIPQSEKPTSLTRIFFVITF
jgi:hypothetical protein